MKAANSYASLLRGVSQQVPQDRAEGQHGEQVNLLSDPVNGLTRRHGSVFLAEQLRPTLSAAQYEAYRADVKNWRSYDFDAGGNEYVLLYRTQARPVSANPLPVMFVYNKTAKTFLTLNRNVTDADLDLLESGGISALTSIGKYVFMCARSKAIAGSTVDRWTASINDTVIWVRGGAYSRRYEVTVTRTDNARFTVSYTTPSSSFQGVLDTSDIATADPDYTKKVNDRVNAYNAAVTQWIGTASAAIQPSAIAEQLRTALASAGFTAVRIGSHITLTNVKSVVVDDGGDGSLMRGVADEIGDASQVSTIHKVGKVVKVRPRGGDSAYYLKAIAKDKAVTSGFTEVTWAEAAGLEQSITGGFYYFTISGANAYIASNATLLDAIIAGPAPTLPVSEAGDDDSSPQPFFVGRVVTYLGTFQSRLLVGSGGVMAVSKIDDYLNFYRSTVLTLPNDDPFEMLPQGSEDDELRESTLYDQDLVIFGKKRQYTIRGDTALTPTSANMAVMASYEDAADAKPVAAGGFIFYTKRGEKFSGLYQIQPGQTENSPESFPASSQIDSYLLGGTIEMTVTTGAPSMLFLRTDGSPNSLYTFAYLDKPDGRKMDSWSRWDFNPVLGDVIGFSPVTDGLIAFTLRVGAGGVYVVADSCPTTTGLSLKPYLDSNRPWASVAAGTGSLTTAGSDAFAAAFDSTSARRFTGTMLPNVPALMTNYPGEPGLTAGALQEAYFEPTNPYMRDGKDKAILSGRLTVTKLIVAFRKSIGMAWTLTYREQVVSTVEFNGRIMGAPNNLIGIEPISDGQVNIPIGRETRQYTLRIAARRWYPFTLTAMEWVGQFFNRVQRF